MSRAVAAMDSVADPIEALDHGIAAHRDCDRWSAAAEAGTNPLAYELNRYLTCPPFDALSDTLICASFENYYYMFRGNLFADLTNLNMGIIIEIHVSFYSDHASYDEVYYAYERRVRHFFQDKPAEKFLEFNVFAADGWPKLCTFLGRELPSVPFPFENQRLEDQKSEV